MAKYRVGRDGKLRVLVKFKEMTDENGETAKSHFRWLPPRSRGNGVFGLVLQFCSECQRYRPVDQNCACSSKNSKLPGKSLSAKSSFPAKKRTQRRTKPTLKQPKKTTCLAVEADTEAEATEEEEVADTVEADTEVVDMEVVDTVEVDTEAADTADTVGTVTEDTGEVAVVGVEVGGAEVGVAVGAVGAVGAGPTMDRRITRSMSTRRS